MPVSTHGFAFLSDLSIEARVNGLYMCLPCDLQFEFSAGHTRCPSCSSLSRQDITALYVEHDADEAEFMQAFDFGEGD